MRIAVVGAGIVGLAVAYELVRAGRDVDCFEAGRPMGGRSCGDTRIFRFAHADPELVDLARQADRGWQDWSGAAGVPLVGAEGLVISGRVEQIAAAMSAAGAPFEITDVAPTLPAPGAVGPFLHDRHGGVTQARSTGEFLLGAVRERLVPRTVPGIGVDGDTAVLDVAGDGERRYDSVVVAVGASTPELVGPIGIDVPRELEHHVRLTFPLRDRAAVPACWLDRSEAWRSGFTSYGQLAGPGRWAVGAHLPEEDTAWSLSREEATERAGRTVTAYVREHVTGCEPVAVDSIYCTSTVGLDDGVPTARVGPVLAVWGSNLFKFAPVLGRRLAQAAVGLTEPDLPAGDAS